MPLAESTIPAAPVLGLMAMGVVVAIVGHIARDRRVQAFGMALLFLATFLMVLLGYLAYESGETDPRKLDNPREPNL